MALVGRYAVYSKHPGRDIGGGATGQGCNRGDWSKNSLNRARFTSTDWPNMAGTPNGYRPPYAWVLPQSSGGLSSYTTILGAGALAGSGALGKNATADLTGVGVIAQAVGAKIVSAVATLAGTGAISDAAALAFLNAAATLTGTGSLSATRSALGNIIAALAGTGTVAATRYATGELEADITPFTDLSPEGLAAAVWASDEGRFLYALAHNKIITDPSAGTFTVYDTDGSTVLYVADLFEDAAGATPYQGSGSERREEFA